MNATVPGFHGTNDMVSTTPHGELTAEEKRKQMVFTISVTTGFVVLVAITLGHAIYTHLRDRKRERLRQQKEADSESLVSKRVYQTADGKVHIMCSRKSTMSSRYSQISAPGGAFTTQELLPLVTIDGFLSVPSAHEYIRRCSQAVQENEAKECEGQCENRETKEWWDSPIDIHIITPKTSEDDLTAPKGSDELLLVPKASANDLITPENSEDEITTLKNSNEHIPIPKTSASDLTTPENSEDEITTLKSSEEHLLIPKISENDLTTPENSEDEFATLKSSEEDLLIPKISENDLTSPENSDEDFTIPKNFDEAFLLPSQYEGGIRVSTL